MPTLKILIKKNGRAVFSRQISKFPILFGRGDQNHIAFPNTSYLSRTHGSIGFFDDKIIITDLNSTNGIFVDGKKISTVKFSKSAFFEAGNFLFEVQEVSPVEQQKTVMPVTSEKSKRLHSSLTSNSSSEKERFVAEPIKQSTKEPIKQSTKEPISDVSELTTISKRLVTVAKKLKFEVEDALTELKPDDIALQAVVTWGKDIFDVRQFQPLDFVVAGNSPFDPISIPSLSGKIKLGRYINRKGELSIPFGLKWRLNHEGYSYDAEQAVKNRIASMSNKSVRFGLQLKDVCTIDLGNNTSLHLRYVEVPRPFIPKTWIENKEVFKKAITVSLIIHFIFSLVSIFSAEKISTPEVENIPPRFAKLILNPPKMLLAPPKNEVILKPEPLPPVPPEPAVAKKEELKPEPKPIPKLETIVKPKPFSKPVAKTKPMPAPVQTKQTSSTKPNVNETAMKPNNEEMADSFNSMFAEVDASAKNVSAGAIKIDKNTKSGSATKGVSVAGVAGALKSQVGKMQANDGDTVSVGQQVGSVGYQSGGGRAGKRNVVSGVVGTPTLEEPGIPQGITQDQVMSVVNKYLTDIHRCYERVLMDNSSLAGRVEYEWNISSNGSVSTAKVKRSEMSNSDSLNKCILAIFYKMKFPTAKNGQSTIANIGFPFGKL